MMTEERISKLKRFGKRTFVGLLAFTLATEQVPWGNVWPLMEAKAEEVVPPLYASFVKKDGQSSGVQLDENSVTLSKKTTVDYNLTIAYDPAATSYTIKKPGIHIDTPTIFRDDDGNYIIANVGSTIENAGVYERMDATKFAKENHYTIIGGVEVAFPGLDSTNWTVWNTNNAKTQVADAEDEVADEDEKDETAAEAVVIPENETTEKAETTEDVSDVEKKTQDMDDASDVSDAADEKSNDEDTDATDINSEKDTAKVDENDTEKIENETIEETVFDRGGVR